MAESTDSRKTVQDLYQVVRRHPRFFLFSALAVGLAVLIAAHTLPLEYTGMARFERRTDEASKAGGRGGDAFEEHKKTLALELRSQAFLEQVIQELGLDKGGQFKRNSEGELTREGRLAKQNLIRDLQGRLGIRWEVRSTDVDVIAVHFTHHDPKLAADVPNALVKNYIERICREILRGLEGSQKFLTKQVDECRTRLEEHERERIAFEKTYARMMPESPGAVQRRIEQVEENLKAFRRRKEDAEIRWTAAQKKLQQLKNDYPEIAAALEGGRRDVTTQPATQPATVLATTPATTGDGTAQTQPASQPASQPAEGPSSRPVLVPVPTHFVLAPNEEHQRLKAQLAQEEEMLASARLLRGMKDTHPGIKLMQVKIERLKGLLAETPELVERPVYARPGSSSPGAAIAATNPLAVHAFTDANADSFLAEREIRDATAELANLVKEKDGLTQMMGEIAPIRERWQKILTQIETEQVELNTWQVKRASVQTNLAAEAAKRRTHLDAVETADEQILPSSPDLKKILGVSALAALVTGGGLAFLFNLLSLTVSTTHRAIEHFDLPVHGVIGEILSRRQERKRRALSLLATVVVVLAVASAGAAGYSNRLRLQRPEQYKVWKADPIGHFTRVAQEAADWLRELIHLGG